MYSNLDCGSVGFFFFSGKPCPDNTPGNEPFLFEDRQKSGPYESWHHQHEFREIPGGVEMTDHIGYIMPMGVFGDLVNTLIVSRRLREVFAYRRKKTEEILGSM